jgi:hypothetical protein
MVRDRRSRSSCARGPIPHQHEGPPFGLRIFATSANRSAVAGTTSIVMAVTLAGLADSS